MALYLQRVLALTVLSSALMACTVAFPPTVAVRAADRAGENDTAQTKNEILVVLEDHVAVLQRIYHKCHVLRQTNSVGGEDDKYERIAGELCSARVELAAARGVPLDDDDVAIADAHVAVLEPMFAKVKAQHAAGIKGGESEKYERLAAKLYAARAQATAARDIKEAIDLQEHACNHAAASAEAHEASYDAGTVTFAELLEAHEQQKKCALALIRFKQSQHK